MDVDLGQLGQPLADESDNRTDADDIHIGYGVTEDLEDVICAHQNPVFICDSNTRAAAEPYLEEEFKDCLVIELSPEGLAADDANMERVLAQLEVCDLGQSSVEVDLLIAIGSRIIHDLTRAAAREYGIPFVSVPTPEETENSAGQSAGDDIIPDNTPRWIFADARILCAEDTNRSERIELITDSLVACGLEKESFWDRLLESDTL